MDSRDLGFSLSDNWCVVWIHPSWPSSTVRVPMSDLSTLSSGTSIHAGDRCLTTLWLLGARASRDTGHIARGTLLTWHQYYQWSTTPEAWSVQISFLQVIKSSFSLHELDFCLQLLPSPIITGFSLYLGIIK